MRVLPHQNTSYVSRIVSFIWVFIFSLYGFGVRAQTSASLAAFKAFPQVIESNLPGLASFLDLPKVYLDESKWS